MADGTPRALVTGAGSGIGAALSAQLVRRGFRVVALDRDRLEATSGLVPVIGDVGDPEVRRTAVQACEGRVDVLVNAAAIRPTGPAIEADEATWREGVRTNLVAAAMLVADAASYLVDGSASILNIASGAAFGKQRLAVYGATKAALLSYSRTLAIELAPRGIRVNAVLPGTTDTAMLVSARASGTGTDTERAPRNLGGKVLDPDAVAHDILAVLELRQVTGAVIPVGLLPWEW